MHPADGKDLNRNFPPPAAETPSDHLASTIAHFALQHDAIVDLHVFVGQISPLIGVQLLEGPREIQGRAVHLLGLVPLDIVWVLDAVRDEPLKAGSLAAFGLQRGIPSFGLELPPRELVKPKEMARVMTGLRDVCVAAQNGAFTSGTAPTVPRFQRHVVRARATGFFSPQVTILSNISADQPLGTWESNGRRTAVRAPLTGTLLTIAYPQTVSPKGKLFTIGTPYRGSN